MGTLSLRIMVDGEEQDYDFQGVLKKDRLLVSAPTRGIKIYRIEHFGTLVCSLDLRIQDEKQRRRKAELYVLGRTLSGYAVVRPGDHNFSVLLRTLWAFNLITRKVREANMKAHLAQCVAKDAQQVRDDALAILGKAGIILNADQRAALEKYAQDSAIPPKAPEDVGAQEL